MRLAEAVDYNTTLPLSFFPEMDGILFCRLRMVGFSNGILLPLQANIILLQIFLSFYSPQSDIFLDLTVCIELQLPSFLLYSSFLKLKKIMFIYIIQRNHSVL